METHVPISGLQHLLFCERQAALIHVERVWLEDEATVAGALLHERADTQGRDTRGSVRIERAVSLHCDRLRLVGKADTVEYHRPRGLGSTWVPFPVEYKRGKAKHLVADQVQLCAQALCLEEMHQEAVPEGALFYGMSHRRIAVTFDAALRQRTEQAASRFHELMATHLVPRVPRQRKCDRCSLEPMCMPSVTSGDRSAHAFLKRRMNPQGEE